MTPTNPDTIHGAIRVVKDAISIELCAETIGKSPALIYKFIRVQARPNIDQCVALDIAYEAATGLPGPIMRAARGKVSAAQSGQTDAHCLNEDIIELADELGAFARDSRKAWADKHLTPLEQAELLSALFRLEMVAHATRENINAHCGEPAGAQTEAPGQIEMAIH